MADSQIYSNEDLQVACQLYLRYIYSDYFQPTPSAFPPGSASNPVVIQDDNPPGSSLNPVVILDDEPLNPRREPHTLVPIPEHLADAVQVQSPALEIEDSSADSGSDSISSRPSPNSDLSVTSGVLSTIPPDSFDSSSTTEASSTSDPSPEPQHSPISDAAPPTSPISDVSLPSHLAFRWHFSVERESPPRRDDSCQPDQAGVWNDTICSKCRQRGHVASAHCGHCGLTGHRASDHCLMCDQIGHSRRDHCILCGQVGLCIVGHCVRAHCKRCGVVGHYDTHHCTRCLLLGHRHYDHCDVCDLVNCKTENHCYVCAELGHSSQDHCENCEELDHTAKDHCRNCKELGHYWETCSKPSIGRCCWICRRGGHHSDTCPSLKQYKLRAKWAFKRLQRSRSAHYQRYCQCCLEIRESRYSFHQEHKLKDCPKLSHKTACLEKDHRGPKCQEWIMRFSRNAATQVNLAEFSTDVDVGEKTTVQSNPLPHSVFTAISSSTQTAFPEVHVGRKSYRSVGSDGRALNEKRLPDGRKVKTMKGCEEVKDGQDSMPSTCNGASDEPAPGALLEMFDNNLQEESEDTEQTRLEAKAQCQQEIQRVVEQTTLEANEEPGIETTSLDTEDSYERNTPSSPGTPTSPVTPSSPISAEFEKIVFKNLNGTLSILEENPEEHLFERADMPVSSSQTSASMEFEQADIQQETEGSSNSQEIGQENLFEYFDVSVIRSSSPVCSDRAHSPSVTRATSTAIDIPMVSQDVPTSPAPAGFLTCSTVRCPNPPSSNDFKCISCRDGRSSIEHKQKNNLLGRASVRKRKHKPRKSLANKKQRPDSNSECRNSAMTDATLQNNASIGNSQAVSLPAGYPISWQELCYTVMLEAPNHSSNFKQLCNLVRNWLHNTFPTIEFDINDEIMLQNLQAVLKNSANFDIHEQPIKRKKKNPIEVSIRENAIKKVKIVVSCFRAKLARPEYYHNMATHLLPKSRARPEVSFENLIGMALQALPNKYAEEIEIVTWIAEMVVGYQTSFSGRNGLGYKYQGDWKQQLREELHASSFFKMRVSEAGDEEWKFRKGCAEYFRKWDDSLHWLA